MLFMWICWTDMEACSASLKPFFTWRWRRLSYQRWRMEENEDSNTLKRVRCKVFLYILRFKVFHLHSAVSEVPQRAVFMPSVTVKEGYLHKHKAEGPQLLSRFAFKKRYFWLTSETLSYAKTSDWRVSPEPVGYIVYIYICLSTLLAIVETKPLFHVFPSSSCVASYCSWIRLPLCHLDQNTRDVSQIEAYLFPFSCIPAKNRFSKLWIQVTWKWIIHY